MAHRTVPDQAYLLHRLNYNPATGILTWRERPEHYLRRGSGSQTFNLVFAGKTTGSAGPDGYLWVGLDGRIYRAHRLIWMMMTGEQPPKEIDHVNRNPSDNRWENLRQATRDENCRNTRVRRTSAFPLKGITRKVQGNCVRYRARINLTGKRLLLGDFKTPGEAHAAYCVAAKKHFGAFWSDGR